MRKITVDLPEDVAGALATATQQQGRSQAELVAEALERYLTHLPKPRLTCIGLGSDPELSASQSEDWLRSQATIMEHIAARKRQMGGAPIDETVLIREDRDR